MAPHRGGHPEARGSARADERRRGGRRGDPDHRHRAQGGESRRGRAGATLTRRRAWRRARRCSRPRWRRCSRSSPPTSRSSRARCTRALDARGRRRRSTASSSTAARARTTPCSCSPTGAPATRRSTAERHAYHAFTDALTDVCGALAEQMARDAEGATKFVARRRASARVRRDEARRAARRWPSSQLVQCSLNGDDPYWGRVLSELGASGAFLDPERVDIAYNGVDRVPRRHRVRRTTTTRSTQRHGRARHRDPLRPAPGSRRGDGPSPPTSRTRTSTRTGDV